MLKTNLITVQVNEYIKYKRNIGYKIKIEGYELQRFATYTRKTNYSGSLTSGLAFKWATLNPNNSIWYMSRRLETIRTFAKYICVFDEEAQIPQKSMFGKCHGRTTPYIYTEEEINLLINESLDLLSKNGLRASTISTAIGLMWCTGLRPSEICRLRERDVDIVNELITVNETKFSKSRLIPLHSSVVEKLKDYLVIRNKIIEVIYLEYFFLLDKEKQLNLRHFEYSFKNVRSILLKNSNKKNWTRRPPRLFDIRHTFACNTILKWHKDGKDVNILISFLSTYMGHVKIKDTYWYLTGTPEIMRYASETYEEFFMKGAKS